MRRLVSPQSFPQLWKKLWKFAAFAVLLRFWSDFSRIFHDRHAGIGEKSALPPIGAWKRPSFRPSRPVALAN
jgi:hypothetical protein